MSQAARNLIDAEAGFLRNKRFLTLDPDGKFDARFRSTLTAPGVTPIRLPPRRPNLNAHVERVVRSIRSEALDLMILVGADSLAEVSVSTAPTTMQNGIIKAVPSDTVGHLEERLACRFRLGDYLKHHRREATWPSPDLHLL